MGQKILCGNQPGQIKLKAATPLISVAAKGNAAFLSLSAYERLVTPGICSVLKTAQKESLCLGGHQQFSESPAATLIELWGRHWHEHVNHSYYTIKFPCKLSSKEKLRTGIRHTVSLRCIVCLSTAGMLPKTETFSVKWTCVSQGGCSRVPVKSASFQSAHWCLFIWNKRYIL